MKTPEESKRNNLRDLFQSVLKDDIMLLTPLSIATKEVFDKNISEVSFSFNQRTTGKNKKVNLKSVKGKGFVDCLFRGCKENYSDLYPSLLNVNLVDLKVRPVFSLRSDTAGSLLNRRGGECSLSRLRGDKGVGQER